MIKILINKVRLINVVDPELEAFKLGKSRLGLAALGFATGDSVAINPVIQEHLNGADRFTYAIPYDDAYYDNYVKLNTHYEIFDNNTLISSGRLIDDSIDLYGTKTLTFESALAYTNDVQYPPYDFGGSIALFFNNVMEHYNSKCSTRHHIQVGQITVPQRNIYISSTDYSTVWECLTKITTMYGGYLVIRYVGDNLILDYLENPSAQNSQTIELGENIINLLRESVADEFADVLIPFGAENEDGTRVDITSVNEGKNFIENAENVALFGRIEAVKYWDDVTLPENLLSKAQAYLSALALKETITVNAVDLHNMDTSIERFKLGDTIHVISQPHNIDTHMLLVERVRNLSDVSKDTITLGSEQDTFTYKTMLENGQLNDLIKQFGIQDLDGVIEKQTKLLLSGKGGYYKMIFNEQGQPSGFYIMDSPIESEAVNVVLMNNNGIGFSHNGINGTYFNAWTIDGTLNANFIYTGTLQDKTGNFYLNLDTGELRAEHFEIMTNDFRFGSDEQYIEMHNYVVDDVPIGVLLDGTGTIVMKPEGELNLQNFKNGILYNQFTMSQNPAEGTGNQIYITNKDLVGNTANWFRMAGHRKYNDSYGNANFFVQQNNCYVDTSISANFFNFISNADSNLMFITNRKHNQNANANSITLNSLSTGNNAQFYNYNVANTYLANQLLFQASATGNHMNLYNRRYDANVIQNNINLSSTTDNKMDLWNYAYDTTQHTANFIRLKAEGYGAGQERSIHIENRNNDDDSAISNRFAMYKKDVENYIALITQSAGTTCGYLAVSSSQNGTGGVNIYSRDRSQYDTDRIATVKISAYDNNGNYKDNGIILNGHPIYFSGGYVRY